ncbi:MAG: hypothetical protein ABL982_17550 [Vicinamibacterales bacterium]
MTTPTPNPDNDQPEQPHELSKRGYFWTGCLLGTFNALVLVIVIQLLLRAIDWL